MSIYAISALINFTASLLLGVFVLRKNRSGLNWNLALFCFSVAFWSYAYFFWQVSGNEEAAIIWVKILTIFSIFIPVSYFRFVLVFLGKTQEKINKVLLYLSYVLMLFFVSISLTSWLVNGVSGKLNFKFWPNAGGLYWLFLLMFGGYSVYSLFLFLKAYMQERGVKREQIKFLLLGSGLGFLGGSTNFFLWYNVPINPIGNILVSFYVLFITYAIIAHRLMDIKLALRQSSVYLVSLSTVAVPTIILRYFSLWLFPRYWEWADFIILILAIAGFPKVKNYYYVLANKYFFSSLYDGQEVVADLSSKLRSTLQLDKIYDFVYDSIEKAFHITSFLIFINEEKVKRCFVGYNKGFDLKNKKKILDSDFCELFLQNKKIVVLDELENYDKKFENQINFLKSLKAEILIPLSIKNKVAGVLVFGAKESGDAYNEDDLKVLEIISSQVAMVIENALLFEETKDFNIKLEKEVKHATRELLDANEKLTKLDKAKSDFISIASHQLRTPLTIIKGYISMLLEGSFGGLTDPEIDSLNKVYASNERLIKLVENLLNVSRIESGRLQFNFQEVQFENVVASVVEELQMAAQKKGLKFIYNKPENPLCKIKADEEKIRQVILNLIDNSIKYTEEGDITINLKQSGNFVEFCVSDSGMGINKKEMDNLFKKFSRGNGIYLVHTEGTGLGLYVARQMVEAHKGKVWAESPGEGKGSKFCFQLPCLK